MTDKHSPTPWNEYEDGVVCGTGEVVATVRHLDADTNKRHGAGESDANARLIAAAPELLAFVEQIARMTLLDEEEIMEADSDESLYALNSLVEEARAAIRKARGE